MDRIKLSEFSINQGTAFRFDGGVNTVIEKPLLPLGAMSVCQNIKNWHPGFEQRDGMSRLHTTLPGPASSPMSLYQFSKSRVSSIELFAQYEDLEVRLATNNPPAVTTGDFGSSVYTQSSDPAPASWSNIFDLMLFSNSVDKHQIYAGTGSFISAFVLAQGDADSVIPEQGTDFSNEVTDGKTTTYAQIGGIDTYANHECIYFRTPVPAKSISLVVENANSIASTASIYYNTTAGWTAVSNFSDGTALGGAAIAQSGKMSWTMPTDLISRYAFSQSGFWYQLRFSASLSADVQISGITYESDFQSIRNVWNGIPLDAIEVRVEGNSTWETYPASTVDLSLLPIGERVRVAFADPVEGLYISVGTTPTSAGATINSIKYRNKNSFVAVSNSNDGTNGLTQNAWIKFDRQSDVQPAQIDDTRYYAYWYEFTLDTAVDDGVILAIQGMPYYDINDFGQGTANCAWKNRAVYSFEDQYLAVSQLAEPMVLNGPDYAQLEAGDGRQNKVVCMKNFASEIMVWQEEKGREGGCLTLFEGYNPATYGKLIISTQVGTMNAKSAVVVDGAQTLTRRDDTKQTLAFFLSRLGVFATDGRLVTNISQDISNYFDPSKDECIRRGYEKKMWIEHDIDRGVLRIGLVSGSSATECNVFPVYDLENGKWSFDTFDSSAPTLTCALQLEADSGQKPVIHIAGANDGFIYLLNDTNDDNGYPVEFKIRMELNHAGYFIDWREAILRMKAISGGILTKKIYQNDVELSDETESLEMDSEETGQTMRRHRILQRNYEESFLSLELSHKVAGENCFLYDIAFTIGAVTNK